MHSATSKYDELLLQDWTAIKHHLNPYRLNKRIRDFHHDSVPDRRVLTVKAMLDSIQVNDVYEKCQPATEFFYWAKLNVDVILLMNEKRRMTADHTGLQSELVSIMTGRSSFRSAQSSIRSLKPKKKVSIVVDNRTIRPGVAEAAPTQVPDGAAVQETIVEESDTDKKQSDAD